MYWFITIIVITATTLGATPLQGKVLDSAAIAKEIGVDGETKGDVYKVSLPRTDLQVTVEGLKLAPGFALGSWIAFKGDGKQTVTHGDLVLTENEVGRVVALLELEGIHITGLHNHLINESPRLMYLHFWGKGESSKLARSLKNALDVTKTPTRQRKQGEGDKAFPQAESIMKVLGHRGDVKNGVLTVNIARAETIKMMGVELPPSMGMATALNFQAGTDGKAIATGDFVMTGEEVPRVTKAMTERGITLTALHNHLLHESPDLYFMHFWANDLPEKVAAGLKAGIEAMKHPE
jgi:hypothetical protein